jgi:hypothetical protein
MSQPMSKEKALEMQKKLERVLEQGLANGQLGEAALHEFSKAAVESGFGSYLGTVAYVGRTPSDSTVQFNVTNGGGYASNWPAWAFEQAKLALTTGKRMWLLANGDPFGSNLINAMVMAV